MVVPASLTSRAAILVSIVACLAAASPAAAAVAPVYDDEGRLVEIPFVPVGGAVLGEQVVIDRFLDEPKVARWLERYPPRPQTDASFDRRARTWKVHVWSGRAGEVATGVVADGSGRVIEAWTGPQVAWKMARGRPGAFGGKTLTSWPVWLLLSVVFVVGLADLRRPLRIRNLDLLVLVSFGVSLAFFNRGDVFTSVSLTVPPLAYLLGRMAWIGFRGRAPTAAQPVWPVWLLAAVTLFLVGFRVGLNVQTERSVIDVGYAGVIGADRILDGQAPYGHMPVTTGRTPCGPAGSDGQIRERIQQNGRCEAANPRGDTYGPFAYLAYVPAVATFGWSGKWDSLPAAHATSLLFDALTLLGLVLVGLRYGGARLAATLPFAWAAFPFTAYALLSNTNYAIAPAVLVWGFWLAGSPTARGTTSALAAWTKLATLPTVPLWLTYPEGPTRRGITRFALAFSAATAAVFSIVLLEPDLGQALRLFWDRTIAFQIGRESPFSIWDWGQYAAEGIPDLAIGQRVVQAVTLVLAGVAAAIPARKGPLELAALTAAILLAVQLSLTHWFYLYLPWVLPFVVLALLLPGRASRR